MKIQAGKVYKDGNEISWSVQCKLTADWGHKYKAGMFLAISAGGIGRVFTEEGTFVNTYATPYRDNLVPNKVKKSRWCAVQPTTYKVYATTFESEEAVRAAYQDAVCYKLLEWEEEE